MFSLSIFRWLRPPWNIPRLAANGLSGAGIALATVALLLPWYRVPFAEGNAIIWQTSIFEIGAKISFLVTAILLLRRRNAESIVRTGLAGFFIGLLFCHLTINQDVKLSRQAATVLEGYDGLTWFGGDIFTSREYEYAGVESISMKDPPLLLSILPVPYTKLDLASVTDFSEWLGIGPTFWTFLRKGWSFIMLGSVLLIFGGISGLKHAPMRALARNGTLGAVLLAVLISGRTWLTASAIEASRKAGENGDFSAALAHLQRARFFLPALDADTGLIFQEGRFSNQQPGEKSDLAKLYRAFELESRGHDQLAETTYEAFLSHESGRIKQEAFRGLTRLAIDAFNSGRAFDAQRINQKLLEKNGALPKQRYLALLLNSTCGELAKAEKDLETLGVIFSGIQMKRSRGVMASGRQHLAKQAYDDGQIEEAWKHFNYRTNGE